MTTNAPKPVPVNVIKPVFPPPPPPRKDICKLKSFRCLIRGVKTYA